MERLESLCEQMESELDALVDSSDRWRDLPWYFDDDVRDAWQEQVEPYRVIAPHPVPCAFCKTEFTPISISDWYYFLPGYWLGRPGNGAHFPACSEGCYQSVSRLMEKRRVHTAQEFAQIGKARRLIAECRATVRRLKNAKGIEGRALIDAGSRKGDHLSGQPRRIPECVNG